MRTRIVFGVIVMMAIAASLAIPGVMATEVTIDAGDTHTKTYDLDDHGWVSWSWTVEGFDSVDF